MPERELILKPNFPDHAGLFFDATYTSLLLAPFPWHHVNKYEQKRRTDIFQQFREKSLQEFTQTLRVALKAY